MYTGNVSSQVKGRIGKVDLLARVRHGFAAWLTFEEWGSTEGKGPQCHSSRRGTRGVERRGPRTILNVRKGSKFFYYPMA